MPVRSLDDVVTAWQLFAIALQLLPATEVELPVAPMVALSSERSTFNLAA